MKNILLLMAAAFCLFTSSCSKQADNSPPQAGKHLAMAKVATEHTITRELADSLIGSYRASISGDINQQVQAWDVTESATMIGYEGVVTVRAYLAHKVEWARSNYGQFAGYDNTKLTLVLVGFDADGYAVAFEEYFCPCPSNRSCCNSVIQLKPDGTFAVKPEEG